MKRMCELNLELPELPKGAFYQIDCQIVFDGTTDRMKYDTVERKLAYLIEMLDLQKIAARLYRENPEQHPTLKNIDSIVEQHKRAIAILRSAVKGGAK